MLDAFRRVILKPAGLSDADADKLFERLSAAVEFQRQLRSAHVLQLTGALQQDEASFWVTHEPAAPIPFERVFDVDAAKADDETILRLTSALLDALRAAHTTEGAKLRIHGGLCGGVLLSAVPGGVTKVSDFGFARAICETLGPDAYKNLAVATPADSAPAAAGLRLGTPNSGLVTGTWEILTPNDDSRADRICAFIDPDKYEFGAAEKLKRFEPASDLIAAGFVLHLLAEHRHPCLGGDPDAHRVVESCEFMSTMPYMGARRTDFRKSERPEIKLWCELVAKMLDSAPQNRSTAAELAKRWFVLCPPVDAGQLLAKRLGALEARATALRGAPSSDERTVIAAWEPIPSEASAIGGDPTATLALVERANKLVAEARGEINGAIQRLRDRSAKALIERALEILKGERWSDARDIIAEIEALGELSDDLNEKLGKLRNIGKRASDAEADLADIHSRFPKYDPKFPVATVDAAKPLLAELKRIEAEKGLPPAVQKRRAHLQTELIALRDQAQAEADRQKKEEDEARAADFATAKNFLDDARAPLAAKEWDACKKALAAKPIFKLGPPPNFETAVAKLHAELADAILRSEIAKDREIAERFLAEAGRLLAEARRTLAEPDFDACDACLAKPPKLTHKSKDFDQDRAKLKRDVDAARQKVAEDAERKTADEWLAEVEGLIGAATAAAREEQPARFNAAAAALKQLPELKYPPPYLASRTAALHKALETGRREAEAAADRQTADTWLAAVQALIDAAVSAAPEAQPSCFDEAAQALKDVPKLGYPPPDLAARTAALQKSLQQRRLAAEVAVDRRTAEEYTAHVRQLTDGGHWDDAEKALATPPTLGHPPPDFAATLEKCRQDIQLRRAQAKDEAGAITLLLQIEMAIMVPDWDQVELLLSQRPSAASWPGRYQGQVAKFRQQLETVRQAEREGEARRAADYVAELAALLKAGQGEDFDRLIERRPSLKWPWPPDVLGREAALREQRARQKRIDADHYAAHAWADQLRQAVADGSWESARKVVAQRPKLEHWPDGVLAQTDALASDVTTYFRRKDDEQAALVWLAPILKAVSAKEWFTARDLLSRVSPIEFWPPEVVAEKERCEREVKSRLDQMALDRKATEDWLASAKNAALLATRDAYDSALDILNAPPSVSHMPADLASEARALHTTYREKFAEEIRIWIEEGRHAVAKLAQAFVRSVLAAEFAGLLEPELVRCEVDAVESPSGAHGTALLRLSPPDAAARLDRPPLREPFAYELDPPSASGAEAEPTPTGRTSRMGKGRGGVAGGRPGQPRGRGAGASQASAPSELPAPSAGRVLEADRLRETVVNYVREILVALQTTLTEDPFGEWRKGVLRELKAEIVVKAPADKAIAKLQLLPSKSPEARIETRVRWDPEHLAWTVADVPALTKRVVEAAVVFGRDDLKAKLWQASPELARYQVAILVELSAMPLADPAVVPQSIPMEARLTLQPVGASSPKPVGAAARPRREGTPRPEDSRLGGPDRRAVSGSESASSASSADVLLHTFRTASRQLGKVIFDAKLAPAEDALRKIIIDAQESSRAAWLADLEATVDGAATTDAGKPSKIKVVADPATITLATDDVLFELRRRPLEPLPLTGKWDPKSLTYALPDDWQDRAQQFVATAAAIRPTDWGKLLKPVAGVAAGVALIAVAIWFFTTVEPPSPNGNANQNEPPAPNNNNTTDENDKRNVNANTNRNANNGNDAPPPPPPAWTLTCNLIETDLQRQFGDFFKANEWNGWLAAERVRVALALNPCPPVERLAKADIRLVYDAGNGDDRREIELAANLDVDIEPAEQGVRIANWTTVADTARKMVRKTLGERFKAEIDRDYKAISTALSGLANMKGRLKDLPRLSEPAPDLAGLLEDRNTDGHLLFRITHDEKFFMPRDFRARWDPDELALGASTAGDSLSDDLTAAAEEIETIFRVLSVLNAEADPGKLRPDWIPAEAVGKINEWAPPSDGWVIGLPAPWDSGRNQVRIRVAWPKGRRNPTDLADEILGSLQTPNPVGHIVEAYTATQAHNQIVLGGAKAKFDPEWDAAPTSMAWLLAALDQQLGDRWLKLQFIRCGIVLKDGIRDVADGEPTRLDFDATPTWTCRDNEAGPNEGRCARVSADLKKLNDKTAPVSFTPSNGDRAWDVSKLTDGLNKTIGAIETLEGKLTVPEWLVAAESELKNSARVECTRGTFSFQGAPRAGSTTNDLLAKLNAELGGQLKDLQAIRLVLDVGSTKRVPDSGTPTALSITITTNWECMPVTGGQPDQARCDEASTKAALRGLGKVVEAALTLKDLAVGGNPVWDAQGLINDISLEKVLEQERTLRKPEAKPKPPDDGPNLRVAAENKLEGTLDGQQVIVGLRDTDAIACLKAIWNGKGFDEQRNRTYFGKASLADLSKALDSAFVMQADSNQPTILIEYFKGTKALYALGWACTYNGTRPVASGVTLRRLGAPELANNPASLGSSVLEPLLNDLWEAMKPKTAGALGLAIAWDGELSRQALAGAKFTAREITLAGRNINDAAKTFERLADVDAERKRYVCCWWFMPALCDPTKAK